MIEASLKRTRLKAYINTIASAVAEIEAGNTVSRDWIVGELRKTLKEARVEPFRGIKHSEEVYEKELISLYIVAARILRIPLRKFGKALEEVFSNEINLSRIVAVLKKNREPQSIRTTIENHLGAVDEVSLSKVVRYVTTEYYLDLVDENEAVRTIGNIIKSFPEFEDRFSRMTKFFVAIVVGSKIVSNEIKSKMELEMCKKAITINLGLRGGAPSDEYIIDVARIAYGSDKNLRKLSESVRNPPRRNPT
ncbi:MAG: DUF2192 domain-containing protein [Sulfolobales archaeon]|nr:DUF2192 domain-containing protein [Sulfolobales archaeon]MCX8208824.1 DUF2192 domain-containing protein [Sulfolobales archaeon]MDW8010151.1 DUF2192 domain-containing protein [Sulfolobales archaeon]